METRWKEIRVIHKKYRLFYELLGGAALLLIGVAIGAGFFGVGNQDYHMNLATEALGIAATVFIIDRIYAHRDRERQREQAQREEERRREQAQREEERRTEELKRQLICDARSRSNDKAITAVEMLRDKGWLEGDDGLLKGANLSSANLKGANLEDANLQKSILTIAELQDAELYYAKLQRAMLLQANLQRAKFYKANLTGAVLINADLTEASLLGADLTGTIFVGATMPDGEEYYEGMDVSKYRELNEELLKQINEIRLLDGLNPITGVDDITDSLPMPTPTPLR